MLFDSCTLGPLARRHQSAFVRFNSFSFFATLSDLGDLLTDLKARETESALADKRLAIGSAHSDVQSALGGFEPAVAPIVGQFKTFLDKVALAAVVLVVSIDPVVTMSRDRDKPVGKVWSRRVSF